MHGKLFIISAPSGAGKSSLVNALMKDQEVPHSLERVITYTSKTPRPSEVNGTDYHFITPQEFHRNIALGFFLEWSNAYGNYYGSPSSVIMGMMQGKSYIMVLDRIGASEVKRIIPEAILIWIKVPCLNTLRQRLETRGEDSAEVIEKRLTLAEQEMDQERRVSIFDCHILNENFENALHDLKTIIFGTVRGNPAQQFSHSTI